MTYDQIPAGPALDALVAEKVMGLVHDHNAKWPDGSITDCWYEVLEDGREGTCIALPPYSTDIAAAWLIVEELLATNSMLIPTFNLWRVSGENVYWWCGFLGDNSNESYADSAPLAICRAALKAHSTLIP